MDVEQFIRDLPWSEQATDHEKTLVAGNLRGLFAEVARATQPLFDAAVAMEQQIDEQTLAEREAHGDEIPDDYVVNVSLKVSEIAALTRAINRTGWADVTNRPPTTIAPTGNVDGEP